MKPKYALLTFRNLDGYFVIKRLSGGYIYGGLTVVRYEVLYPENIDSVTKRFLHFNIKGNGSSVKGTIFKKEKFHDHPGGVIKDLFCEI